jgi:membrane protein
MNTREVVPFLREVASEWSSDQALSLGAALAYYTVFSLAPLLVLVIAIAGLAFGETAARGEVVGQIQDTVGPAAAELIEGMIERASRPSSGLTATLLSLVTMVLGASGAFGQLQSSLNQIWGVKPGQGGGLGGILLRRLASFGMILGVGFLLLVSLALSALLSGLSGLLEARFPLASQIVPVAHLVLSFAIVTALFAMIYKVLPDVEMEWRDVWLGAFATSLLFSLGKGLIGLYLGRASVTSVYGAAGSLVLVLLWVYYSSQILFLGAELTEVYSRRYGSRTRGGGLRAPPAPANRP